MRSAVYPKELLAKPPVLTYPDPILSKISDPVGAVTDEIAQFAQLMIETLHCKHGAGLAAPQLGLLKRMIVVDPAWSGKEIFAMIDPAITDSSGEVVDEEGCLSIPFIFTDIPRPQSIKAEYTDLDGAKQVIEADGFLARCIAHEIDHLDGILFWDRLGVIKRDLLKIRHWRNQG